MTRERLYAPAMDTDPPEVTGPVIDPDFIAERTRILKEQREPTVPGPVDPPDTAGLDLDKMFETTPLGYAKRRRERALERHDKTFVCACRAAVDVFDASCQNCGLVFMDAVHPGPDCSPVCTRDYHHGDS